MMRKLLALTLVLVLLAGLAEARDGNAAGNGNAGGNGNGGDAAPANDHASGGSAAASDAGGSGNGQGGAHADAASETGSQSSTGQETPQPPGNGAAEDGQARPAEASQGAPDSAPGSGPGQPAPAAEEHAAPASDLARSGQGAESTTPAGTVPAGRSEDARPADGAAAGPSSPNAAPAASGAVPASEAAQEHAASEVVDAAAAAPQDPVVDVRAVASPLTIQPSPAGNHLLWDADAVPSGAQVQVWRSDGGLWVPVAAVVGDGSFLDAAGVAGDEYRITWSQEPLDAHALAAVSSALPLVEMPGSGWAGTGRWLTMLMVSAMVVFGLVRTAGPRRILEARLNDSHDLVTALAGLPGFEGVQLERVVGLGLRTVGQLRRLDADAVAFWAGLPGDMVRRWQQAIELLQWQGLPPGVAERLALAGHASLPGLAHAKPSELLARLKETSNVEGPGLPADEAEVALWVAEARQAIGMGTVPAAMAPKAAAAARFTWPTAATP